VDAASLNGFDNRPKVTVIRKQRHFLVGAAVSIPSSVTRTNEAKALTISLAVFTT
jgi:hypothetical protein